MLIENESQACGPDRRGGRDGADGVEYAEHVDGAEDAEPVEDVDGVDATTRHRGGRMLAAAGAGAALLAVGGVVGWATVARGGVPDPLAPGTGRLSGVFDIGVLVFREGLESILVLTALTASMTGARAGDRRPVAAGVGVAFVATLVTWLVAIGVVDRLTESVPALHVQAATGLLAIVVLLVVMNWFFHKVYWTGWIRLHNSRKKRLVEEAAAGRPRRRLLWGFVLLGFTSFYREGFEVVLFLQSYRLRLGGGAVFYGVLVGAALASVVAVLTFVANRRLPYKRMLVFTGVMLGAVLLVMVGEQVQEMQLAGWLPTTPVHALEGLPAWLGLWFAVFPNVQTLCGQALALVLVAGSFLASRLRTVLAIRRGAAVRVVDPQPEFG